MIRCLLSSHIRIHLHAHGSIYSAKVAALSGTIYIAILATAKKGTVTRGRPELAEYTLCINTWWRFQVTNCRRQVATNYRRNNSRQYNSKQDADTIMALTSVCSEVVTRRPSLRKKNYQEEVERQITSARNRTRQTVEEQP